MNKVKLQCDTDILLYKNLKITLAKQCIYTLAIAYYVCKVTVYSHNLYD